MTTVNLETENNASQHQIGACDLSAGRESKSGAAPVAAAAGVALRSERLSSDKRAGGRTSGRTGEARGGQPERVHVIHTVITISRTFGDHVLGSKTRSASPAPRLPSAAQRCGRRAPPREPQRARERKRVCA
jgi:hypothetical protein